MKGLHKKISALLLAGAIVMGGCLSSAHALSMKDFVKQEGFLFVAKASNEKEMDKIVQKIKAPKSAKKRLLEGSVKIKNIKEFEKLLKSGKKMHRIKVGDYHYLILFDEVRMYAASRVPKHKFYDKSNQRNYDIVDFYSKKYNYDIIFVEDSRNKLDIVKMNAEIRSRFGHKSELLEGPEVIFKDAESIRLKLKSGVNVFEKKGYSRVKVGNLEYVLLKK